MAPRLQEEAEERGSALLLALILLALLGLVGAEVLRASRAVALRAEHDPRGATLAADTALAKAKVALLAAPDEAWSMAPNSARLLLEEDGAQVMLTCLSQTPPGPVFLLEATAPPVTLRAWVRLSARAAPLPGPALAALLSNGDVRLTGNVSVDGRDHASDGQLTGDAGVLGVLAGGSIDVEGSAQVGGVGLAPSHPGAPGALDPGSTLWTEPDPRDGLDDDGDGLIDEAGPPADADAVLLRPAGTLRALAQGSGTFFTSLADYEAWRAASNPQTAGGKVVFLELPPTVSRVALTLPDNAVLDRRAAPRFPAPEPSIVVATRVGGGLEVGPLHAPEGFQGVAVLDRLRNANGTGSVIGMLVALDGGSHTLGNGALRVLFSAEVLASLPGDSRLELAFLFWTQR
ncbi:MAG: hypothetical protein KDD82_07060 [Planctomycetes bacterium]|nr:hypothetical protein [Planctomycetota bacterium]